MLSTIQCGNILNSFLIHTLCARITFYMAWIVRVASLCSTNRCHFFLRVIYDHVDLFSAVTRVTSFLVLFELLHIYQFSRRLSSSCSSPMGNSELYHQDVLCWFVECSDVRHVRCDLGSFHCSVGGYSINFLLPSLPVSVFLQSARVEYCQSGHNALMALALSLSLSLSLSL